MIKDLNKIQQEKTREAQEFFDQYEIKPIATDDFFSIEIPSFNENTNSEEKNQKFHWTRLSINSNVGYVIE